MSGDLLDQPGVDTYLAHLLLARGALDQPSLEALLAEVRGQGPAGLTLARSILQKNVLERPALEAALADLMTHETAPQPPPQLPVQEDRIGDYRILERLGAGGMGVVHLAEHTATGVRYAIKTLYGVQDPEAILRFQREAQGHARVDSHPNVVRVHSFGQFPGGLYLVVELVSGGSLAERLKGKLLSIQDSARLVRDLARGVAHIHAHGVLHRDLKPDNILLDGEVPRLADFGLAKVVGEHTLTVTGTALGTPAYMAPEQIDSTRGEPGPWTDVYGLGAVLYECLTGRPPFVGVSAMATLVKSLKETPAAPSGLRQEIPAELEEICLRCLVKDPERRIRSAESLIEDLDRFLAGGARARRGQHRVAWVAMAGVLAVMLGVLVWARVDPPPPLPDQGETPRLTRVTPVASDLGTAAVEPSAPVYPRLPFARLRLLQHDEARVRQGRKHKDAQNFAAALEVFEGMLLDPVTGKIRPGAAGKVGDLLGQKEPRRATALLFEASLFGDNSSARSLALGFLSPDVVKGLDMALLRASTLGNDNALSAACVRVYLTANPGDGILRKTERVLRDRGAYSPALSEAYKTLWGEYAKRYPVRAAELRSKAPPLLPLQNGTWDEFSQEDYEGVVRPLSAFNPKESVTALRQFVLDPEGRVRANIAGDLGWRLFLTTGDRQGEGLDYLTEAALRGDAKAARFLCLANLRVEDREALAAAGVNPSHTGPFAYVPNLAVAAACAKLHEGDDDDDKGFGEHVLRRLSARGVSVPTTVESAYQKLWRHYNRLRRLVAEDPSSD